MTPVRFAARSLLGYTFIRSGLDAVRNPEESAEAVRPLVTKLSTQFPQLPKNPTLVVRATGAVQIVAGLALATGRVRRLSAVLLAASLIPSGGLVPKAADDATPEAKARHAAQFQKNLAVLGGLVLAAVDTEGRPGISWWAHRATRDARRAGESAAKQARKSAKQARKSAKDKLPLG